MAPKRNTEQEDADIRRLAEKRLRAEAPTLPHVDPRRLLHELQVHQIQLEMQNAELRAARSRVLILSAHNEDAYVEGAIKAGAAGFVLKHSPGIALAHAIREIHAGRQFFSAAILQRYREIQVESRADTGPRERVPLTPRESEVLQLIVESKANKEAADLLGISIKTVEKHRTKLMRKLNIHDTAGLTRYAISAGIIESSSQRTVE